MRGSRHPANPSSKTRPPPGRRTINSNRLLAALPTEDLARIAPFVDQISLKLKDVIYRPGEPVLPWLYAIARHISVDHYRKAQRMAQREQQVEVLPEAAAPTGGRTDRGPDLGVLLGALPESQREVITMLKVSGMSLEEVARATRSSVGSVKQKAHRAYEKLRALLKNEARDEA